ncbi:MAG: flagellar hook-length control protein FliK [Desulfuromonadales bacterium]|nr:flagellar hook-length control protein FliK [Desulfuromonadales bacterium]MBN2792315.1 flagellar hook-length control protein FliK [Desulfuromonadales bacterium]
MQALAMIDMVAQKPEVVSSVKGSGKSEQSFGKVLSATQRAQAVQDNGVNERSEPETATLQQNPVENDVQVAELDAAATDKALAENTLQAETCAAVPQGKIQQALVKLMKNIGRESSDVTTVEDLDVLVTDFVQKLEQADLHGEQVLAGVDLSLLAKELGTFKEHENQDVELLSLAEELKEQLVAELSEREYVTAERTFGTGEQQQGQSVQEPFVVGQMNLSEMRQLLQQVIDTVTARRQEAVEGNTANAVSGVEQQSKEEVVSLFSDTGEEIDPRFAGLLKPREENGLHQHKAVGKEQAVMANNVKHPAIEQEQRDAVVQSMPIETAKQGFVAETELSSGTSAKQMIDNLIQQATRQIQPQGQAIPQHAEAVRNMPQTPVIHLDSGQAVAESQIFDQVVTHLSGSFNGESGRMVLRLQPAELGSLKLELKIEGDRVQANLHAQNQQVQEVLERNLPQLRNALAEQGLKIEQFQVNIDRQQQGGQFENLAQQQQNREFSHQHSRQQEAKQEEQMIPLAHLMQNGGGGISLHV